MARIALMRVSALVPVRRFLRRIGAPVDRLLQRLHLPADLFADPEALIPAYLGTRFIAEGARSQGIETLGALAGESTKLEDLGTFGRQLLGAVTLHDVIRTAQRIGPAYHSGERFFLTGTAPAQRLCQRFVVRLDDWQLQTDLYALLTALVLFRSVAGSSWRPTVYLQTGAPKALRDVPALRDADLVFDQPLSAIGVSPALLRLPLTAHADDGENGRAALTTWRESGPANDLVTSLRQWLSGVLRTDAVRIDVLCRTIGTTPRTLQRRLAEAGTTYGRVLAQARFGAAIRLLARDDHTVRDVAYAVGYRDAAHLTRAFHRWSGASPSAFRRSQGDPGAKVTHAEA